MLVVKSFSADFREAACYNLEESVCDLVLNHIHLVKSSSRAPALVHEARC